MRYPFIDSEINNDSQGRRRNSRLAEFRPPSLRRSAGGPAENPDVEVIYGDAGRILKQRQVAKRLACHNDINDILRDRLGKVSPRRILTDGHAKRVSKQKIKRMQSDGLRIGFDVAQTCQDRAGCGWVADRLVREMVKLAPQVKFFLYHQFGEWTNEDTTKGTHLASDNVQEPLRSLKPQDAWELWQSVAAGAEALPGGPDIVHANGFQAPLVGSAKLVYTVYDLSFWIYPEYTTEENRLSCQRGTLEAIDRAAALVFLSKSSLDEFEGIFPGLLKEKGIKYSVALLASRFESVPSPRLTAPTGGWLAVGSLEPRKNYQRILDAFEIYFAKSIVKRRLTIAGGEGWKSETLRRRINELQRHGLVNYEGYVEDGRLSDLYAAAFALIFPSHYESFGLPVAEAMSQACPVITRKNSSLPEVGGSAAIYCNDDDEEIVEAMLRLERDQSYYRAVSQASLAQASNFSWSAAAGSVLNLYAELVPR